MPHLRQRYASLLLKKLSTFSSLVGVLGHRQVGKTTLISQLSQDYRTLDSLKERKKILLDPEAYVDQCKGHPTVIDESQLVPELFPALKERVRKNKKPGQFILSGSVRFTSKKAIRESLTGRIQYLELLPMTVSEIHHHELPTVISELLNSRSFYSLESKLKTLSSLSHKKFKSIHDYRMQGGLPGVCFMRDLKLRRATWENYLQTILDRDLRQVFPTTLSFDRLLEFMEVIAKSQGEPYRYQTVREQTGLTPITQQKLLYALESVFLIRRMKIEGDQKGFIVLLEDQGESYFLSGDHLSQSTQWVHLLYRNVRQEFNYRLGEEVRFFQYRTRSGVLVPLACGSENQVLGFLLQEGDRPSRVELAAVDSFFKKYKNSKIVLFKIGSVHDREVKVYSDRLLTVPLTILV